MKYTIETEDEYEAKVLIKAKDLWLCLFDIEQHLRAEFKYNVSLTKAEDKYISETRDKFQEFLNKHGVTLDELV